MDEVRLEAAELQAFQKGQHCLRSDSNQLLGLAQGYNQDREGSAETPGLGL